MKISIFCTIFAVVLARFAFILFKKKIIRMKKILLGLLLIPAALWAQTQTLTGKIVKKPWTKSSQSYCAQGSDYLVLSAKDGSEYVLDFSKNNILYLTRQLQKQFPDNANNQILQTNDKYILNYFQI